MRFTIIVACGMLAGCAPGHLEAPSGRFLLRTGVRVEADGEPVLLFASTGMFSCNLSSYEDPAEQEQARLALTAAILHEGARHLLVRLGEGSGDPPTWDLAPGEEEPGPGLATASWLAVEEVALVESSGLSPVYQATEYTCLDRVPPPGKILAGEDGAEVSLEALDVRARFSLEDCAADSDLGGFLASGLVLQCP